MNYLSTSFALSMIPDTGAVLIKVVPVSSETVADVDFVSIVGHSDARKVLEGILHKRIMYNRVFVKLNVNDVLYVAQYTGERLPKGATLPDNAPFKFIKMTFRAAESNCHGGESCGYCEVTKFTCCNCSDKQHEENKKDLDEIDRDLLELLKDTSVG